MCLQCHIYIAFCHVLPVKGLGLAMLMIVDTKMFSVQCSDHVKLMHTVAEVVDVTPRQGAVFAL
jgi:hypothetical protein